METSEVERPMALWATPRSVSTVFERIFIERGDFEVFHEPFSFSYYHSEDRRHDRYAQDPASGEYNFDRVLEKLTGHTERPVFFKDMAYYVEPVMTPEFGGALMRPAMPLSLKCTARSANASNIYHSKNLPPAGERQEPELELRRPDEIRYV